MVDEVRKSDLAREERMREQAAEKAKPKQRESEFDQLLKTGQMQQQATVAKLSQKPVTEQAMQEATKREQREAEQRLKEREERKDKKETKQQEQRDSTVITDRGIVGKSGHGESGGGGGQGKGGFDSSAGRRGLSKKLSDAGVKTLPADLEKKFAARLIQAQAAKNPSQAVLTQQVLNKIIQHVRMGINRAGEKEIQIDLNERIFRGLKLRVTSSEGKVGVHFRTADSKGRAALEKNSDQIREALAKKGIEVTEITVA